MRARTLFVYKVIGAVFLLLGVLTFLNLIVAWDVAHAVLWQALGYCIADFAIAYGCFSLQRWVLYAFGANTAALVVLLVAGGVRELPVLPIIIIVCSGILAAYTYQTRRFLRATVRGDAAAVLFFLAWGSTIIYTGIIELHLI